MVKKVDFTRTGDCQKVLDFVLSLDCPMCDEQERLATDAVNTLRLNSTPQGPSPMDYVRIGLALVAMHDEKER